MPDTKAITDKQLAKIAAENIGVRNICEDRLRARVGRLLTEVDRLKAVVAERDGSAICNLTEVLR